MSLLSCAYYFSWFSWEDLLRPRFVLEDIPIMCAYFQSASEGNSLPFIPHFVNRLNAPYSANWADFPTSEKLIWLYGGLLTRLSNCLTAYNLAILSAHLMAAWSMYFCARLQGANKPASLLVGFVYSTSRFIFARDAHHINLVFCWHIPLYWVACRWLWEGRLLTRKKWIMLITLCFLAAWQNPYFWYAWMLMLLPCWLQPLLIKDWHKARSGLLLSVCSLFWLVLANIDSLMSWILNGRSASALDRNIGNLQVFGLHLPDLLLPFRHNITAFDQWAQQKYYMYIYRGISEADSAYLGLLAIIALGHIIYLGIYRLARRQPVPFTAGMLLWLVLVAIVGGLNLCAGCLGLLLFRATSRFSIVILAGILLHLAQWLTQKQVLTGKGIVLLFVIIPISCLDTMPPRTNNQEFINGFIQNQRSLASYLESSLPPAAMVFQWPVVNYPETPKINHLERYEQFYPYLLSKNLRFSYGNCKGRLESEWQHHLNSNDKAAFIKQLESYGFTALILYRSALTSEELSAWDNYIWPHQPAYRSYWNDMWVYRLQPSTQPVKPAIIPTVAYGPSFYSQEQDNNMSWRWAVGDSYLELNLPDSCHYQYQFGVATLTLPYPLDQTNMGPNFHLGFIPPQPSKFKLWLDGKFLKEIETPGINNSYTSIKVDLSTLRPGVHRLQIQPQNSQPQSAENGSRLSFRLINPTIKPLNNP